MIKSLYLFSSLAIVSISTPLIMISCSSSVDQKYIDKFYSQIVNKTNWTGHDKTFASSIYDLKTFKSVFPDILPTNEELSSKGFIVSLDSVGFDSLGKGTYTIYLKNKDNLNIYYPTPTEIDGKDSPKEPIVSFSIDGFLKSNREIDNEFTEAYKKIKPNYELNAKGKDLFKNQNIETSISFDDPESPNYLEKLFEYNKIEKFSISSFGKINVNDKEKKAEFKIYLTNGSNVKGPGAKVSLSLN